MSDTPLVLLAIAVAAMLIVPMWLASRTDARAKRTLKNTGLVTVATITSVERVEDLLVRFEFTLPDGHTVQKGLGALPLQYKLSPGDRVAVRYNAKLPSLCELEPQTDLQTTSSSQPK